jgi:hypothetical protein
VAISAPIAWALHRTLGRWIPTGGRIRPRRARRSTEKRAFRTPGRSAPEPAAEVG